MGPGLLESAYEECVYYELSKHGFEIKRQHPIPVVYKNIHLDCGYRADLIINEKVLIELKSIESINPVHVAQILTYMRFAKKKKLDY